MSLDDSYSVVLLHCNGADASVVFTDESGKTWTAVADAQLDTAQKKFGTASGLFDGAGDYIYSAAHDDFAFGTGAWTIDFWFRPVADSADRCTFDNRTVDGAPELTAVNFGMWTDNTVVMHSPLAAGQINSSKVLSADTWYHIAFVGNGGASGSRTVKCYIDGVNADGFTSTADYNITRNNPTLGSYNQRDNYFMKGHIDEFRVSKGIARWTADFTPETTEYGPYADTSETATITDTAEALHLVDSTSESVTLTDVSEYLHLVDSTAETVTLTDAIARHTTSYRSASETVTMTDAIEELHLVDSTAETATITDYMFAVVNDDARRRRQKVNYL